MTHRPLNHVTPSALDPDSSIAAQLSLVPDGLGPLVKQTSGGRTHVMTIERIFIGEVAGGPQIECESVVVVAGRGIQGDRYFGRNDEPGQNITLVEAEELEAFKREHGGLHEISMTHRNLITRGIRLNELVGKKFMVGNVELRGVELCEPCLGLGSALTSPGLSAAAVVKRFLHRGGLRADVLSSGVIDRGAEVTSAA